MTALARNQIRLIVSLAVYLVVIVMQAQAQNRGVYPLGMSATNSGVTPGPGFTYVNQLLFYSRDHAKDNAGDTLTVTGENYVLMDMNTLAWVSKREFLGKAAYSLAATLPFAKNDLTSDIEGNISGGGGLGDSYYLPFILGWNRDRVAVRVTYGFLAPTGRFASGASDNVGSGYWTQTLSSGQTFYVKSNKHLVLSAFQLYEFHSTQEGTDIQPGETFDLDYSLMGTIPVPRNLRLQIGAGGYEQRQTTAKTGPTISPAASKERYAVNSLGFALSSVYPSHRANLGLKYFKEFQNRSTFQGYSLQISGSISF
ncbi:MAG TPA: transporter [Granulicella sp.]|nr:transporter [Granulicella sp.]